jgi:seryl-tRNA synthetase
MSTVTGDFDPRAGSTPLFSATGIDGIYGRTGEFELVVQALGDALSRMRPAAAQILNFPPVMNRAYLERSGYFKNFQHLSALVARPDFEKDDAEPTDLALTPAACYPLYPHLAQSGPIAAPGACFDTSCFCFRREPSRSADRLQSFRMREFVLVGAEQQAKDFRDSWIPKLEEFVASVGLDAQTAPSFDPFFGRMAPYLEQAQLAQQLKFELSSPIVSDESPTAIISFNYHQDHFGQVWNLRTTDGLTAHSACVAVGIDRMVLALFRRHGLNAGSWPDPVKSALRLA